MKKPILPIIVLIIGFIIGIVISRTLLAGGSQPPKIEAIEQLQIFEGDEKYTEKEKKLKNKILEDEFMTVDEWANTSAKLLEKMIKKAKITDAEFLNEYRNKYYHKTIKNLDKKIQGN